MTPVSARRDWAGCVGFTAGAGSSGRTVASKGVCGGAAFTGLALVGFSLGLPALASGIARWPADFVVERISASRRTPNKKSPPSLRQFRAIAGNCSRCHLIVRRDPMATGRLTRMHAPDAEVSSRMAGTRKDVPLSSSQMISATAHITFRGSMSRPSMPSVSAIEDRSLVTSTSLSNRIPDPAFSQGLKPAFLASDGAARSRALSRPFMGEVPVT